MFIVAEPDLVRVRGGIEPELRVSLDSIVGVKIRSKDGLAPPLGRPDVGIDHTHILVGVKVLCPSRAPSLIRCHLLLFRDADANS